MIFIDTSAILAFLNKNDINHKEALNKWRELIYSKNNLITTNYVIVETLALLQNRFGIESVRAFQEDFIPLLTVEWIDEAVHNTGVTGVLTANRRDLSLIDCISFIAMREKGIKKVFTFDKHFKEQGFESVIQT